MQFTLALFTGRYNTSIDSILQAFFVRVPRWFVVATLPDLAFWRERGMHE